MNPGRYWTGIPTKGWLVVVVVVVRTVVVVVGVGVGCRTTSSVVHDPKEIATPMKRTIRDMIAIDRSRPVESASPILFFDRLTLPLGITRNDRSRHRSGELEYIFDAYEQNILKTPSAKRKRQKSRQSDYSRLRLRNLGQAQFHTGFSVVRHPPPSTSASKPKAYLLSSAIRGPSRRRSFRRQSVRVCHEISVSLFLQN